MMIRYGSSLPDRKSTPVEMVKNDCIPSTPASQ
jgi:hypothetical protein